MSIPDIKGIRKRLDGDYTDEKMDGRWTMALYADLRALLEYVENLEEENLLLAEQNSHLDAKLSWFDDA